MGTGPVFLEQAVLVGTGVMPGVTQVCGSGSALSLTSGDDAALFHVACPQQRPLDGPTLEPGSQHARGQAVRDVVL